MVEGGARLCFCLFDYQFCLMPCVGAKESFGKSHYGEQLPPIEGKMYYILAKPIRSKKMAFCVPCITEDHIPDNLLPKFRMKKSSKGWETLILILSVKEAW